MNRVFCLPLNVALQMESIKSMASVFSVYNLKSPQRHFSTLLLRSETQGQSGPRPDEGKNRMVFLLDKFTSERTFELLSVKLCLFLMTTN